MPNHVTHRIKVSGSAKDLKRFAEEMIRPHKGEGGQEGVEDQFDFNLLIPMPKELKNATSGGDEEMSYEAWYGKDWKKYLTIPWVKEAGVKTRKDLQRLFAKRLPGAKGHADRLQANVEKYGTKDWYDWAVENWGTKWNSYSFRWGGDRPDPREWNPRGETNAIEFYFETAWSPPEPIFQAVSERYPSLLFDVGSFDEGWNFACRGSYEGGRSTYECLDATDELYEYVYGHRPEKDEE